MLKPITSAINSFLDLIKHWFSYIRLFNKQDILDIMDEMREKKLGSFKSKSVDMKLLEAIKLEKEAEIMKEKIKAGKIT